MNQTAQIYFKDAADCAHDVNIGYFDAVNRIQQLAKSVEFLSLGLLKAQSNTNNDLYKKLVELLDDDGPILLTLRENIGDEISGLGWRDEDGHPLHSNDKEVEGMGDYISDIVKAATWEYINNNILNDE